MQVRANWYRSWSALPPRNGARRLLSWRFLFRALGRGLGLGAESKCSQRQFAVAAGFEVAADDLINDSIAERGWFIVLDDFRIGSHLEGAFTDRDGLGGLVHSRELAMERSCALFLFSRRR